MAATGCQKLCRILAAKLFAPRCTRRLDLKIGITKRLGKCRSEYLAASRDGSVTVEAFAEEFKCQGIDHHVAGTGVKGDHRACRGCGRNGGEVGDAADVLQHAATFRMSKEDVVEQGNERRALS